MAFKGLLVDARSSVLELYRHIMWSWRERHAIQREGDWLDPSAVTFKGLLVGAGSSILKPYRLIA